MRELFDQKLARYDELERDLVNPEVLSNPARITAVVREHGSLGKLAKKYKKFKQIASQMAEAQQMIAGDDPEMRELAEAELPELARPASRCGASCSTSPSAAKTPTAPA